jgi:hypothetical protein
MIINTASHFKDNICGFLCNLHPKMPIATSANLKKKKLDLEKTLGRDGVALVWVAGVGRGW